MLSAPPRPHVWTRERFDACVAAGIFGPEDRVQLIEGELVEMAPQHSPHAAGIRATEEYLRKLTASGFDVRTQLPLALGDLSEPEPDVAVVRGHWRDYVQHHPTSAELVIEIADRSLEFDRTRKRRLYAAHRVPEYWIVNLLDRQVEVHREPSDGDYRDVKILRAGDPVAPLFWPGGPISAGALLP